MKIKAAMARTREQGEGKERSNEVLHGWPCGSLRKIIQGKGKNLCEGSEVTEGCLAGDVVRKVTAVRLGRAFSHIGLQDPWFSCTEK